MNRSELRQQLVEVGLANHADALMGIAQECIRLNRKLCEEDTIPLGASKLGGSPDLPDDVDWPEVNGTPHSFLLQIDLAEARPFDPTGLLPETGHLYFFLNLHTLNELAEENGIYRLIYHPAEGADLRRTPLPQFLFDHDTADDRLVFPACRIDFDSDVILASDYSERMHAIEFADERSELAFAELYSRPRRIRPDYRPFHQMFGNPKCIQYEQHEPEGADGWLMLLQIDFDPLIWLNIGDAGFVQAWLTREALQARDFSAVECDLQMH